MLADARQKAAKLAAKAKDAAIEQGLKAKEAAMEQAAKAKEAAKEQASKGKEYALEQASKGKDAATIMRAERTEGLLDERLQQKQATIVALQKCYHDLAASLKHEADRANKSAKSAKETHEVLERLKEAGSGASLGAARLAPALSSEAALSGCWEAFAAAIEVQLLGPARQLTAVFQEAEKVYAAYCALANELASKQSALKRVHGLAAMVTKDEDRIQDKTASAHDQVEELTARKGAMEESALARLADLHEAAEEALAYLCERHAALHASHLQAALAQCAEKTGAVEAWEEWRRATEAGWEDLAAAQFEAVGRTSSLRVSKMPSKGELVGYSLEELAGADEAVGGVPLVAHLLMERISAGQVGVAQDAAEGGAGGAQRMVAADGIFRISGEADEVHALGDALHAADAAAALAVARQTDPYVLAACLKQFYRRLARPLFPESKYQALLQLGAQLEGGGGQLYAEGSAELAELQQLVYDVPDPNYSNLRRLLLFLCEVAAHKESNRMDTPNLAIVFAPNIARPDELSPNELAEAPLIAAAVSSFIRNAAACFGVSDGGGGDAGSDAALSRRGTEATAPSVGALGGSAAELRPEQAGSSDGGGGQWWYSQEGEQLGPVTAAELQRLLQEGTLHMGTYVFEDGTEDWAELHTMIDKL